MDILNLAQLSEKEIYKSLIKRLDIYVDKRRVDYLQTFVNGLLWYRSMVNHDTNYRWLMNYELQCWVMLNQSVCIRSSSSLSAWNLFYRCFGYKDIAMMNFRKFLNDTNIPPPVVSENLSPADICVAYDVNAVVKKMNKETQNSYITFRNAVVDAIKNMIEKVDEKYGDVKVYVCRDKYFCQVRFIYYAKNGWKDDCGIISNVSNYHNLVKLHAIIECISEVDSARLNEFNDGMHFHIDFNEGFCLRQLSSFNEEMSDKDSLYYRYQRWREATN